MNRPGAWPRRWDLIQRQPTPGGTATERTDVKLLSNADYIYIGVVVHDSEPQRIIGTQMARDASLSSDDRLEILLDTYRDQRNAFYFATNPSGAMVDGLISSGELNTEWDAIWQVRTSRNERGWVAEFAIPYKSLSFPATRLEWGFNISRTAHRKLEESRWSRARLETDHLGFRGRRHRASDRAHAGDWSRCPAVRCRPMVAYGRYWLRRLQQRAGRRRLL
jgi:hypothetical protein